MPIRKARALPWPVKGCSDALDGTDAFKGAMQLLANLVPDPTTDHMFVPRAAANQFTDFVSFNTPTGVTGGLVIGDLVYGMVSTARNAGKDEPFVYNLVTNAFITVNGITNGNTPSTQATTGDWTPPTMDVVGSKILVTHPGFSTVSKALGWFDISGFTATPTGDTHTSTLIDNLSSVTGLQPGMTISGTGIPANTTILGINVAGMSIIISNATTSSLTAVMLTIAGGTPAAPLWAAGDLSGFDLNAVATCVKQFNNRAYYGVGNLAYYSDVLAPLFMTNAGQALTIGDSTSITAFGTTPFNATTGGILQSLIAFKKNDCFQIQGDAALSDLTLNAMNVGVGTSAPRSVTATPLGLAFIADDGLRMVNFVGNITPPIGDHGKGIAYPFISALHPSRVAACYNADTLRISVQNAALAGSPFQDWWLDLTRDCWTGPHTFPANLCLPWSNTFVIVPQSAPAGLWQSNVVPSASDAYIENGAQLQWDWQTVLLPDTGLMALNSVVESSIGFGCYSAGQILTFIALDENGNTLSQVQINIASSPTIWGSFTWGAADWLGGYLPYQQHKIPWDKPLVANQMSVQVNGFSAAGFKIGNLFLRYQPLGYMVS